MYKIICLMAAFTLFAPAVNAGESISEVVSPQREYMVEGDIVTIWDEGFLLDDGSDQIVVDARTHDSFKIGLQSRMTLMILGRLQRDGTFRPSFIVLPTGQQISYSGVEALPPMDMAKVMENTRRYRIARKITGNSGGPGGVNMDTTAPSPTSSSEGSSDTNTAGEQSTTTSEPGSGRAGSTSTASGIPSTEGTPLNENSPIMQRARAAAAEAITKSKSAAPDGAPTERPRR